MASPRLTEPFPARLERSGLRAGAITVDIDPAAVCEQLDRILASPVFRNSKRYSSLLKHVVERVLDGRPEDLKERTIGVDVFGRAADYDTNADHVVRSVAGEVRRRLAQYYMEPGHDTELRIELLSGSYVPQFRPAAEPPAIASAPVLAPVAVGPALRTFPWHLAIVIGCVLLVAVTASAAFRWLTPPRAFDQFWGPFLASSNTAQLCVGGGGQPAPPADPNAPLSLSEFERQPSRRMHASDALALAGIAAMLQSNRKPYHFLNRAAATSFRDLQSGPFVLIGGMNNEWTLRLTSGLRFTFERQPEGARVIDRQNPTNSAWSVNFSTPFAQFNRDYAIVSRIRDPRTEQIAVIAAGIASWGTLAASEFVTSEEHLKKLDKLAPGGHWDQKNVQVVIATDVIHGSSGPPTVLAAHFW